MPNDFASLSLSPALLSVVSELGYSEPTPIQTQSIPVLLSGGDLIGQSRSGSGKTAAFSLPILDRLDMDTLSLQALVLCPSRELCAQVTREIRKLGRKHQGLQVLSVSGGESIQRQMKALERGVHVVVGTPGRLLDHQRRGTIHLKSVRIVVLDEADRMLDMGFRDDIETILNDLPSSRQTALFSATFPPTIEVMSRTYQKNALRVSVCASEQAVPDIRQLVLTTETEQKFNDLRWLLTEHPHETTLVFCNLKATVKELSNALADAGASVDCLHGDLEQFERDRVMAKFRNESVRILIASDVAARGIDVIDLDIVINYDLPSQPEVYVHRIGRTGRAGKNGLAISFATVREHSKIKTIERFTGSEIERLKYEPIGDANAAAQDRALEHEARMETIKIWGGRKNKIRPGDIVGALTGDAGGLKAEDIGAIEIHDRFSYVAVKKAICQDAVQNLNEGRIKGKRFRVTVLD